MRKILITNDDGIGSDGIERLARAAAGFGQVWVVAPDGQRSAASHSISLRGSIEAWEVDFPVEGVKAYACSGTPADCARIGILNIVEGKPDVLLSGINYGYNLAGDVQYSATAGAAFEGAFQGIRSIALSEPFSDRHEATDAYLVKVLEELLDKPAEKNAIWNVNFPDCEASACRGILRERKISEHVVYKDTYSEKRMGNGHISYSVVGTLQYDAEEGSDYRAILDNYVSIGMAHNIG